jgi:hypothetical protein
MELMLFMRVVFWMQVRVIDVVKYRQIHEDVMKKLDKLENEFLPQVMVDNTEIILDTVRYLEPQKKELIIANTGQVRFISITQSVQYMEHIFFLFI